MKLFTVGPVEMYPETLKLASEQLPYFRTPEFSEVMFDNDRLLKQSMGVKQADKTIFLTASGTGAMEATVMNCFSPQDRLLIINGGSFGERFSEISRIHNIPYDEIKLEFGETLTQEKMEVYSECRHAGLLVNLHETSTGQLYDIQMLSDYCKEHQMFLVVDAIGACFADTVDFAKYGIDVLILSSQKALALSPGISMVVISERMYKERVSRISPSSLYFDFKRYIVNLERGQTPYTPAVGILLELQERLHAIQELGIERVRKNIKILAERFREKAIEKGFRIPNYPLSNALTPVILTPYAEIIYERLKEEYGLVVTPSGGALKDTLVRVGHLGNLEWSDYEELLENMKQIQESL